MYIVKYVFAIKVIRLKKNMKDKKEGKNLKSTKKPKNSTIYLQLFNVLDCVTLQSPDIQCITPKRMMRGEPPATTLSSRLTLTAAPGNPSIAICFILF